MLSKFNIRCLLPASIFCFGLFDCAYSNDSVCILSLNTVREIIVEDVDLLGDKKYGKKTLSGERCRDIINIIQSCKRKRIVNGDINGSFTVVRVCAMYNGFYTEITLPTKSGQTYFVTLSERDWNKIRNIINGEIQQK